MGEAALARARELTWEHTARVMLDALRDEHARAARRVPGRRPMAVDRPLSVDASATVLAANALQLVLSARRSWRRG